MNQQDTQQSSVEDLTVTQDQASEVKGGAVFDYYLKVNTIEGEATEMGGPIHGGWNLRENKKL